MPGNVVTTQFATIKVEGSPLSEVIATRLLEIEVESTYNRPSLCTLMFDIDANTEIPPALDLGKPIEVSFKGQDAAAPAGPIFKGEVTALDYDGGGSRTVFVVQCEDLMHRLFRLDKTRTFLNSKINDVVTQMAGDCGLSAMSEQVPTTYEYLMQQNQSDGAWLVEQASKRNFHVWVNDKQLCFKKVGAGGDSGVTLEYGRDLLTFTARVTANAYLKEATVNGWDVKSMKEITGTATTFDKASEADPKVKSANNSHAGTAVLVRTGDLLANGDATQIAEAVMERANEHSRQAEGTCFGNPKLKVDTMVEIKGATTRVNKKYRISRIRHRYSADEGYTTEFSCRGASDQSISGLVEEAAGSRNRAADRHIFDGVAVGLVTNNKDEEGMGRVKVKFPALKVNSTEIESDWMRIAFPGAGGDGKTHRGWFLLPEVGDEVLVIFEQGDARRGYVLGGLHNGMNKPFYPVDEARDDQGVNFHAFRSKLGSHLLFDDKAEKIEIKNKDDKFTMTYVEKEGLKIFEQADKKIVIDGKGNIEITSQSGDVTIETKTGGINLKAKQDVTIEGMNVNIKAQQGAKVEGAQVGMKGQATAEVSGANTELKGSAMVTVSGGLVKIN